jgi:hypothetical protein
MKKEFKLNDEEMNYLISACKPQPYMIIGNYVPESPQENANNAWKYLGNKLGFIWDTVEPIDGKDQHCFMAETKE